MGPVVLHQHGSIELMGLDVGEKRVGVAVTHERTLVKPLTTLIRRRGWREANVHREQLFELVRQHNVGGLAVGWPLLPDGRQVSLLNDPSFSRSRFFFSSSFSLSFSFSK